VGKDGGVAFEECSVVDDGTGGGGVRARGGFVATHIGFAGRLGWRDVDEAGVRLGDSVDSSCSSFSASGDSVSLPTIVVCLSRFFTSPDDPDPASLPPVNETFLSPADLADDTELANDPLCLLTCDPVLPVFPVRLPVPAALELAAVLEVPPEL